MSKRKPMTPYEEAMQTIDRIIEELDEELRKGNSDALGRKRS